MKTINVKKRKQKVFVFNFSILLFLVSIILCSCSVSSKTGTTTTVKLENARFEFLTPSLVRMEYSPSGQFVNSPTLVMKKRTWPAVEVKVSKENGWLTARTEKLTLKYQLNSGAFNKDNLKVVWSNSLGSKKWYPSKKDSLNLGGLFRSYNQVPWGANSKELKEIDKETKGLLSKNGYVLVKDSYSPLFDSSKQWVKAREQKNNQDWYLCVYGHNYEQGLNDFAKLSGKASMLPRYALYPWITDLNFEYFPNSESAKQQKVKDYNANYLKQEVLKFRKNKIPLGVFVLDYGWHNYGWKGGYDWSPLIPKPKQFLEWMHEHGVKIALNEHPGYNENSGVLFYKDSHTDEVRKELNLKPIPPKPAFQKTLTKSWKFRIDPDNVGMRQKWFNKDVDLSKWESIKAGEEWEKQGYPAYDGYAWYRKLVKLPAELPDSLYLILNGVDDEYDLFINGHQIAHHGSPNNSTYNKTTHTDISKYIKKGQTNLFALRVNDWGAGGGLVGSLYMLQNTPPRDLKVHFDLANRNDAKIFWKILHKPFMDEGVDFWWIDGGTGSASFKGLDNDGSKDQGYFRGNYNQLNNNSLARYAQLWTNREYYVNTTEYTGNRSLIFSRYGGLGSQRYPAIFTGDAESNWGTLASEVRLTSRGNNVIMPYITNDIGGFNSENAKIDFDLYARWFEFGVFSPIFRLHSANENPWSGNVRMPWMYGKKGMKLAKKYLRLRSRLIPYIYTYTRIAYDKSISLLRPLYMAYPDLEEAYQHPHEYFFGKEILVAPIINSLNKKSVYLPPGSWINYFTGKELQGGQVITEYFSIDEIPVYVRAGSIVPEQPLTAYEGARSLDTVILNMYGSGDGVFKLYNDDGISFEFKNDQYAWTKISYTTNEENKTHEIIINPTEGSFGGQVDNRSYQIYIHSIDKPKSISVNGKLFKKWTWNQNLSIIKIDLPKKSIRDRIKVNLK